MLTDGDEDIVSPSQLVIPECVESNPDLDLGMADRLSDSTVPAPPPPKRLRLTLAHFRLRVSNNSGSRFSNPVNSPECAKAAKGVVSANTEASTPISTAPKCALFSNLENKVHFGIYSTVWKIMYTFTL